MNKQSHVYFVRIYFASVVLQRQGFMLELEGRVNILYRTTYFLFSLVYAASFDVKEKWLTSRGRL